MGGEERERIVQQLHPLTVQPRQTPKPGLDPVQRRQDVEARDREIAPLQVRRDGRLRELCALPKLGKRRGQSAIRLRRPPEDDERAVATSGAP
jgi:hypothetical protein